MHTPAQTDPAIPQSSVATEDHAQSERVSQRMPHPAALAMLRAPSHARVGSPMRLSTAEIAVIRTLVRTRFGSGARIWLFGSRLDDDARGGDIDLYVEPGDLTVDNLFLARQAVRLELERQLRLPVDLVINPGRTTAFMRQAREEGCSL